MKKLLYIAGLSLALGNPSPAQDMEVVELDEPAPVSEAEVQEAQRIGQEFLQTASNMWFLLSGISNKADADKAAPRFTEQVKRIFELDSRLSALPLIAPDAECVGMMDTIQLRILETMDDLHVEFMGICRDHCYGSKALVQAFEKAVQLGMFAETDMELLHEPGAPLTEDEARLELARLRLLLEPDRAVLNTLVEVQNEEDATEAVETLIALSAKFSRLLPDAKVADRGFAPDAHSAAQAALTPIEPVLWAIRSEIVRIAALPGYEAETYDKFSEALDTVFESLGATHALIFDSVFDASFRADLDNALRENSISSQ